MRLCLIFLFIYIAINQSVFIFGRSNMPLAQRHICTTKITLFFKWTSTLSKNVCTYFHLVNNNNNNSFHLYSTFLGTRSALHRRGNLLNHHQCAASTWMMWRQPYCARMPTTHKLIGGEETVMKPIGVWGWLGGRDVQRPVGEFGQDAGVTPLLFFEGHPGIFNDHRGSGLRFNISSEAWCLLTV